MIYYGKVLWIRRIILIVRIFVPKGLLKSYLIYKGLSGIIITKLVPVIRYSIMNREIIFRYFMIEIAVGGMRGNRERIHIHQDAHIGMCY